jgi:hypothetical protein
MIVAVIIATTAIIVPIIECFEAFDFNKDALLLRVM